MRDDVLVAARELAPRVFPAIYKVPNDLRDVVKGGTLFVGPFPPAPSEQAAFVATLIQDPELRHILRGGQVGAVLSTSGGLGWQLAAEDLGPNLVGSAARLVMARAEPLDEVEPLLAAVEECLEGFRRLFRGEETTAWGLVAMEGLRLTDGRRLEIPWGEARWATERDMLLQPFESSPAGFMLLCPVPIRGAIGDPMQPEQSPLGDSELVLAPLERASQVVALAALLAAPDETSAGAGELWRTTIVPGGPAAGFFSRRMFKTPPWKRREEPLAEHEEQAWLEWINRLEGVHDGSIDLAGRRTLLAARERYSPEDALVDAVIAWEALVGAKSEVVLRVTAALARLLEENTEARRALRTSLGKIYEVRSAIVHGGHVGPKDDLPGRRDEAIRTAIRALRVILRDRPELIDDKERSLTILLGP